MLLLLLLRTVRIIRFKGRTAYFLPLFPVIMQFAICFHENCDCEIYFDVHLLLRHIFSQHILKIVYLHMIKFHKI